MVYPQDQYTLTMAPRIARRQGDHRRVRRRQADARQFVARDAQTGQLAWRFYTVPGDPSKPFENEAMRTAAKTWGGEFYKNGGGGAVGMASLTIRKPIWSTSAPATPSRGCRNSAARKNVDNLYTCSILAVDLDHRQLKWHYQTVPNDNWDYDSVQQLMLLDLNINGRMRKVIMQAPKNGFFYVLDRVTGEFISAAAVRESELGAEHGRRRAGPS